MGKAIKRIIEGDDRAYTINVYYNNPMDRPKVRYVVTLSGRSHVAIDRGFNDSNKALAFIERALNEGHLLDVGTGTPAAIESIRIDQARDPLVMDMRVRLEGRGTGRINRFYMASPAEIVIRMDDGRMIDTTVFDVTPL